MVQGEVHPSSDNPIVRAVEIPAVIVDQAVNSTGNVCFVTVQCLWFLFVVYSE